jgi:hypothetical protein
MGSKDDGLGFFRWRQKYTLEHLLSSVILMAAQIKKQDAHSYEFQNTIIGTCSYFGTDSAKINGYYPNYERAKTVFLVPAQIKKYDEHSYSKVS